MKSEIAWSGRDDSCGEWVASVMSDDGWNGELDEWVTCVNAKSFSLRRQGSIIIRPPAFECSESSWLEMMRVVRLGDFSGVGNGVGAECSV